MKMHSLLQEFVAEFFGTACLMVIGISGSATSVLSGNGSQFNGGISYAIGVIMGSLFAGEISGAHLNPAFTLAFCIIRKCSWQKLPIYFAAQYLGSFAGSALAYLLYYESMHGFDDELYNGTNTTGPSATTAGIFITIPATHISIFPAIVDQVVSTGLLAFVMNFIGDESLYRTPKVVQILASGVAILAFVVAFNYNCGAIFNPARDLSPRLFLSTVGYSDIVFDALDGYYWWTVGILSPHVGAIIGCLLYILMSKMRNSYVKNSHSIDDIVPPCSIMSPERDIIYQKARIVINENIKSLNPSPPHSRY